MRLQSCGDFVILNGSEKILTHHEDRIQRSQASKMCGRFINTRTTGFVNAIDQIVLEQLDLITGMVWMG